MALKTMDIILYIQLVSQFQDVVWYLFFFLSTFMFLSRLFDHILLSLLFYHF